MLFALLCSADTTLPPQSTQRGAEQRPVFRASVDLATVDVVVVDQSHRQVRGLGPADFEVTVRGRVRPLRQVLYIKGDRSVPEVQNNEKSHDDAGAPSAADTGAIDSFSNNSRARADSPSGKDIVRTIAVVVDDLQLSFESVFSVRSALRRFVDEQLGSTDLVAILRTAAGVGALQQFTRDRRMLQSIVANLRWTPMAAAGWRSGVDVIPPATDEGGGGEIDRTKSRAGILLDGTLATVEAAIQGMKYLPGRKSIVLFSEALEMVVRRDDSRLMAAVQKLIREANEAGAVIYAIDPRGLFFVSPGDESRALNRAQESLRFFSESTGGFAVVNSNDLSGALGRVLEDQSGYYLLAYDNTDADGGGKGAPGCPSIRVKRDSVTVRSRCGQFGPAVGTSHQPIGDALEMAARLPFSSDSLDVRLTALAGYSGSTGTFVNARVWIDSSQLHEITHNAAGNSKLELLMLAIGDNGQVVGRLRREITLQPNRVQGHASGERIGLVYTARASVSAPGSYQIRVAVQDHATGRVGSAGQFLTVPQVRSGRLAISGILMRSVSGQRPSDEELDQAEPSRVSQMSNEAALNRFSEGDQILYAYEIYNGLPADAVLMVGSRIIRDGQIVSTAAFTPIHTTRSRNSVDVIRVAGHLSLDTVEPGSYSLEVLAGRQNGDQVKTLSVQWSDFDIVAR